MSTTPESLSALISHYFDADHNRLEHLLNQFIVLLEKDKSRAIMYFGVFEKGLHKHVTWEEEVLFPWFEKLSGNGSNGPTHVMYYEHGLIKESISEIKRKLDDDNMNIKSNIQNLLSIVQQHHQKEEKIFYPMLDKLCDEEATSEIFLQLSDLDNEGSTEEA
ncbi:hemerythrin domain-containing protein [Teredinibacter sp. KSP-S5-2]|uniref:hemerythrin domain-containing protein n=1 Tax=Teredinibacter sp. KSP-S5-2 TaxID=3034506 RepID=UPI0029347F3A|nr:hemerythrin domain-containing protein [Teredinibacter sp. KSP-S5-2]WNO11533.1 hemerythrin domain-containing protein [Teredinibacter sp. KSP-S5-2]